VIVAAALCPAPPLLARELTGADPVLPELRRACLDATAELLRADPDLVIVVGVADSTRPFDADGRLDVAAYAPALASRVAEDGPAPGKAEALPLPLGLGSRLLDQAGYARGRLLYAVGERERPAHCAALGARLATMGERAALLVMADGSARRGLKAPGYLDPRSVPFDAGVERAVRAGDMAALLTVDSELALQLMATGRAAWHVLAGALAGRRVSCEMRYCGDPFGVAYLVASLMLSGASGEGQHPLADETTS
jgi:hypothetical protein